MFFFMLILFLLWTFGVLSSVGWWIHMLLILILILVVVEALRKDDLYD